jgi:hypothetical protein
MTFEDIKDIRAFIISIVEEKITSGQLVNQHWTTTEILNQYDDIEGGDSDFYIITARTWVNSEVKRAIGKYESDPSSSDDQLTLDGFQHLQRAYPIVRDGDRCLVPVEQMTYQEFTEKAEAYSSMSQGLAKHSDEIFAFRDMLYPDGEQIIDSDCG